MDLNQLRQFRAIAEEGTIAAAAEKLYTSPSALSKGLQKLEDDLGIQLFSRGKKNIELNDAGKLALPYVQQVFDTLEAMQSELKAYTDDRELNILRIASDEMYLLRYVIPLLAKQIPISEISEQLEQPQHLEKGLMSGKYDIILSEQTISGRGIICRELFVSKIYVSIPKENPLAEKHSLGLSDLAGQKFLIPSNSFQNVANMLKKEHRFLELRVVDDYILYREMLNGSDYLSLVGTASLEFHRSVPGREIRTLEGADALQTRASYAYRERNAQKIQPFILWAQQTFQ